MSELQLLRPGATGHHPTDSFEQERREVLESVMGALSSSAPDADEMAACVHLLQHLGGAARGRAA